MELMARNVYTRQNDNYEIYFWILYVQNSEIRKYSLWILLVKMCWVRKLSKSEYKSNSIPTYFKPDCKTNIVPIVCLSQCELGNLFGGKDILNVRIKTQTMEFAGDNNKTDWGGWIERRLSVSIYGAEVKGPQPASPPYQYYTKKLELAEKKQVWKKDSMTNGEAIFPKRPVKTTGFFFFCQAKKNLL